MRWPAVLVALAVPLVSGSTGCDTRGHLACTEIGCHSGYSVAVVAPARFADGTYRLQVTSDGLADDCAWTIAAGRIGAETCDAVYAVGASHPAPEAVSVSYPRVDDPVRIVVTRDGVVLDDRTETPVYRTVQPNGPDCPPACHAASARIVVD